MNLLRLAVDVTHDRPTIEAYARALPELAITEEQVLGIAVGEERGQRDPVVWRACLIAEDLDVPGLVGSALDHRLDETVGDHSGADDGELLLLGHAATSVERAYGRTDMSPAS